MAGATKDRPRALRRLDRAQPRGARGTAGPHPWARSARLAMPVTPRILSLANAELRIFHDTAALARGTAAELVRLGREAIAWHGRFDLALAGGSTPRGVYCLMATEHAADLPWANVHLFF